MCPTYRTAYKLPLGSSVLHLGQPQPQPFNPLIPNELRRRRAVRPFKIKISSKNLGRQLCTEGFNFVAKRLKRLSGIFWMYRHILGIGGKGFLPNIIITY